MDTSNEDTLEKKGQLLDHQKEHKIIEACKWKDIDGLRVLAESPGGFLTDELRQQAWPILLGVQTGGHDAPSHETKGSSWKELPPHKDEHQVGLDVERSFVHYPVGQDDRQLSEKKNELSALILGVLRRYPFLCYFQGYHDICTVLLLVLPTGVSAEAAARLSVLRIRDFMLPSLKPALVQLDLLPDILRKADPALSRHLSEGQVQPWFALSGALTMYAHEVTSLNEISRLFDSILTREPAFTVYMCAAIVLRRRAELLVTPATEQAELHRILSKLPRPLNVDALVTNAAHLLASYPPDRLRAWRRISSASVLRTARDSDACANQSMADGEIYFQQQAKELRWQETLERIRKQVAHARLRLWRHRWRMSGIFLAVVVSIGAVWLRKWPGSATLLAPWPASWSEYVWTSFCDWSDYVCTRKVRTGVMAPEE